ncbi:MAG: tRNA adenosine(34) deaminase TadA [Thermodesulfovibrionales bacterium]
MDIERDEYFMRLAIKEAGLAFSEGEVPVGAVLVGKDGRIISLAHNKRESLSDPTAHAEIIVLREGAEATGNWRLTDTTLYVTKEPCVMCAGAIVNSRIKKVVYGCLDPKGGGAESLYNILSDRRLNHQVEITKGVLEKECASLLKRFFEERR